MLNDELARCVEQLDEFVEYIKLCFDESRAELQIERDLLDEMNFINAGLDLWKNRCTFSEGGGKILQDELASVTHRNRKLVCSIFFVVARCSSSQKMFRFKKCHRSSIHTSQSNHQMVKIFRAKRVTMQ